MGFPQLKIRTLPIFKAYPIGEGSVPQDCPPTLDASCKRWFPKITHFCLTWLQVGGSRDPLLRFDNLLHQFTESWEMVTSIADY